MNDDDHLSNPVSIKAKLEENSLEASAKSRAVAAFDRLLGSALDVPTAYLENLSAKARVRGQIAREALIEATAITDADQDTNEIQFIRARVEEDASMKLENLSKVADRAADAIRNSSSVAHEESEGVDPDWLNRFKGYSENVSESSMQELWGQVLAGEIRTPSTFSLSTLRFLSEVDQQVASAFQRRIRCAFHRKYIPPPTSLSGAVLEEFGLLEDSGLVRDVGGMVGIDQHPNEDGKIFVREGTHYLDLSAAKKVRIPVISITRVGQELMQILPEPSPHEALEAVFNACGPDEFSSAKIYQIVLELPNGQIQSREITTLK